MFDFCFIDLDDTIYNTRELKDDIFAVFESFGIGREDFLQAYESAAKMQKLGYFHYTFEKQIQAVREFGIQVPDDVLPQLENLLDKNYIIPETEFFLSSLREYCSRLSLLTAGTKEFQARKVKAIAVEPLLDEIILIDGGKDDIIRPLATEQKRILFVNDNLAENKMIKEQFPETEVITKFNPSYWKEEECEKSGMPWFKTLSEILNYLKEKTGSQV